MQQHDSGVKAVLQPQELFHEVEGDGSLAPKTTLLHTPINTHQIPLLPNGQKTTFSAESAGTVQTTAVPSQSASQGQKQSFASLSAP
ncbi:hypothetical protein LguiA_006580 [Lonicera macranthoides]